MRKIVNILCVCRANTCRSLMMAAFLNDKFQAAGISINVVSAGIIKKEGMPASKQTLTVMAHYDIDVSGHRSRFFQNLSLDNFQIIYCTDEEIKRRIIDFGAKKSEVRVINQINGGIPNPVGKSYKEYESCAVLIESETRKIVNDLY